MPESQEKIEHRHKGLEVRLRRLAQELVDTPYRGGKIKGAAHQARTEQAQYLGCLQLVVDTVTANRFAERLRHPVGQSTDSTPRMRRERLESAVHAIPHIQDLHLDPDWVDLVLVVQQDPGYRVVLPSDRRPPTPAVAVAA